MVLADLLDERQLVELLSSMGHSFMYEFLDRFKQLVGGISRQSGLTKFDQEEGVIPKLEFRVPISPTRSNMLSLHYLLESIQVFGGPIARNARCIASVGADEPYRDLKAEYEWTNQYPVDFHWVDHEEFRQWSYDATGFDRFRISSDADIIALIDADLIVAGCLDEIVEESYRKQQVLGTIAHVSPFGFKQIGGASSDWWAKMYQSAGIAMPTLNHQYTGWGLNWDEIFPQMSILSNDPDHRFAPPYFNYGVIFGPRTSIETIGCTFIDELEAVVRVHDGVYRSQIANCLAFERHGIRCAEMSVNYNFPLNLPGDAYRALNPDPSGKDRYSDIRIFHYIGGRMHFENTDTIEELLARSDLDGAWPAFQGKLGIVHDRIKTNSRSSLASGSTGAD